MNSSAYITIPALYYTILLLIVYFYKKRISLIENKIYIGIMITTLISIILFLFSSIFTNILVNNELLNSLILKLYLVSIIFWITLFTTYTYATSRKNDINKKSKVKKYVFTFLIIAIIVTLLILSLPLDYLASPSGDKYIGGICVNIVYLYTFVLIVLNIFYLVKNIKNIGIKKFFPLIIFILLGIVTICITIKIPSLLLNTPLDAFITFLMYFTLENPDIVILEEYSKASENMVKMMSEKDLFQYNVYQKTKYPLSEIQRRSTLAINALKDNLEEAEEIIKEIWMISNDLQITIDNTINTSSIDSQKIKVYNTKYNIRLLLDIITKSLEKTLADKPVKLLVNTSPMLPKYLYDDSGNLKEAITIVTNNAANHTEEGYISIDTNYVVKDDICRVTIIVEDSGDGIPTNKLTKVYKNDSEKDTLTRAKKILESIGGTLLINTKIGTGSKVTIIIEQKLVEESESKIDEVTKDYLGELKILIVNDDEKKNNEIKKKLSDYNIKIDIVTLGIDCLKKIRNEEHYDIVFIKDKLPMLDGIKLFTKLKDIDYYHTPTYLLTNSENNLSKQEEEQFAGVVNTIDQIAEIIKEQLKK